ncbi:MAG TPA: DMT family transporter [Candidatus Dormibacteraeota bacterium]|nr:DMT family transporter [Candidatus Dormibacteraeota bacterium]
MSRRGWLLFGAMCVIWGIPYLLIKVAVTAVTPATLVFLRTSVGGLLLLPLAIQRRSLGPLLPRWRSLLVYTVVEVAVPWLLLSDAERRLSSSLSGLLVAAVPLVGALIALLVGGGERLDARRLGGLLVGLAGVAALLGFDIGVGDIGAVAEVGLVTVGYATGPLIISRRLSDLPADGVITASLLVSAAAYAPLFATQLPAVMPSTREIVAIGVLAVVCTALAFLLFFSLITEVGPLRATVITYVNPAVAVTLGVVLLGEPFTAGTGIGFVLILAGSFLATRRTRQHAAPAAYPVEAEAVALPR